MQVERVRVIIGDPNAAQRRPDKQDRIVRVVLTKSKRALASESGKALLRKRGEHLERSFCHVLDHGKHRLATLCGRENLTKRQLAAAFTHNLPLLMRHLTGHGTPKQLLASTGGSVVGATAAVWAGIDHFPKLIAETHIKDCYDCLKHFIVTNRSSPPAS